MKARVRRKKVVYANMELFLYTMQQLLEMPFNTPLYNLLDTFEGWADRNGLLRRGHRLEAAGLLESDGSDLKKKVFRMTEKGRVLALGGVDPAVYWNSQWDGLWRMVSFDFPESMRTLRRQLRDALREHHFGHLQDSLWVTPHNLGKELLGGGAEVDSLGNFVVVEARFKDGARDQDVVEEAWDFEKINKLYERHAKHLAKLPGNGATVETLQKWAQAEMERWHEIVIADPFLPAKLLPHGYAGKKAWANRLATLKKFGKLMMKR